MRHALLPLLLGAVASVAGCPAGSSRNGDAGADGQWADAGMMLDGSGGALALDFTVSGCPSLDRTPRCTGRAPLTLEFVPISSGGITRYLWDFGDGTPQSGETRPIHTYNLPGLYAVALVGGGNKGTASRTRAGFVVVTANEAGDPCEVDIQCATGLSCVCGSAGRCTAAFVRGICAASCQDMSCRAPLVCADLSLAARDGGVPEAWERPLCLRPCKTDDECGAGLRCRDLPGRAATEGWVRGCFPDHPLALGASCRGASGQLRNELCVTGQCADLGGNGVCSQDCSRLPCPGGSACAALTDGRRLCLRACGPTFPCTSDPLLACVPANPGPLGFTVSPVPGDGGAPAPTTSYCAPKTCLSPADCGPSGTCRQTPDGSHCTRRAP